MSARGAPADAGFPIAHLLVIAGVQVVWGCNFVVSKLALAEMPPLIFIALRFAAIAFLLLPFMRWHRGQMRFVMAIGLSGGAAHFGMMILSLHWAEDVAPVAIAIQLGVPFATLLSVMFLGERLGIWRVSALVISFTGILVMSFDPSVLNYLAALVMATGAALMWALSAMFMRKVHGIAVYDMQGWIAWSTWPALLAGSLIAEPDAAARLAEAGLAGWGGLAYTIFAVSLLGHAGLYWTVQRHEITSFAPVLLLAPIIGALGGVLVLGDDLTWRMVAGGAMTLAGVLVITIREARRQRLPTPPADTVAGPRSEMR